MKDFPLVIVGVKKDRIYFSTGQSAHIAGLRGVFYARNLEGLAHHFEAHTGGVVGKGSPQRGVTRLQRGRHLYVFDIDSSWMTASDEPIESAAKEVREIRDVLGPLWDYTAASTAIKMIGERGRLWKQFIPPVRKSYRGGYQWSVPGFYKPAYFFDLNEAYGHALFDYRMPVATSWVQGKTRAVSDNTIVRARIIWSRYTPTFVIPTHPVANYAVAVSSDTFLDDPRGPTEVYMWAFELAALEPWIDSLRIIETYSCSLSWRLPDIVSGYEKHIRRRLQNQLYGAFGVQPIEFNAHPVITRDDVMARIPESWAKSRELAVFRYGSMWWARKDKTEVFSRPDIASLVTSIVRRKMLDGYWACHDSGHPVIQMYVDGIITTGNSALPTGGWRGEWKLEHESPWVSIGYPGCYLTQHKAHSPGTKPKIKMYSQPVWAGYNENPYKVGDLELSVEGGRLTDLRIPSRYLYLPAKNLETMPHQPLASDRPEQLRTRLPTPPVRVGDMYALAYSPTPQVPHERGWGFANIQASAHYYRSLHAMTDRELPPIEATDATGAQRTALKGDPETDVRKR